MALVLKDRVKETGTANTTVSFTLSGAVAGYQSFSVVGNANTTYYAATDSSGNWEAGLGTYSTTGPTLTRTTILSSSNSGSAVTFSGTVSVFLTYPSSRSLYLDGTSAGINVSQAAFTSNGIPYASSTSALATSSALTFNGTDLTTTGKATAARLVVTSATAPGGSLSGLYTPAASTLGLYAGGYDVARVTPSGVGIFGAGTAFSPFAKLQVSTTHMDGTLYTPSTTNAFGFYVSGGSVTGFPGGLTSAAQINVHSIARTTLDFGDIDSSFSTTTATTLYIANAPAAGTYNTISNSYALYVAAGNSYFGGASSFVSRISLSGSATLAEWGATGSAFNVASAVYTSTGTLTGTVAVNSFARSSFAALGGASTVTNAATLYIEHAPYAGTLVTITNAYSLYIANGASYFGGTATFAATGNNKLIVSGAASPAAWTTTGVAISVAAGTYTSSAGLTGTVASSSFAQPTFAATTASQTVTNAATLYIAAAPAAGTNVTITNAYSLYIAAGAAYFGGAVTLNSGGALTGTFTGTPTFSGAVVLSGTPSISNGAALTGTFSGNPAFSGNSRFGGTSAATVAVDVTGAVLATGNVTGGYNNPSAGTTAMAFGSYNVVKVTPNATASFTTTVPAAGTRLTLIVLTSGTTSYTITFSTGFKTTGTLVTGTTTARYFMISFVSDGTNVLETARTVAIA